MSQSFSIIFLSILFISVLSHPLNTTEEHQQQSYDSSNFLEVYDERQNGTENYRVNIDGVVVLYTGPSTLLSIASLLGSGLLDSEYEDLEEFFQKPDDHQKPLEQSTTVSAAAPTTSSPPPPHKKNSEAISEKQQPQDNHGKRKLRLPSLIRPFLRRHH